MVPAREIADPQDLQIRSRVNGKSMQDSNTSHMIFGVAELISYISHGITLEAGDVISTGTPDGVGAFRHTPIFLASGDTVEVEIEGIGILSNPVLDDPMTGPRGTVIDGRRSDAVTRGNSGAAARAMLRATGFTDADFGRPQVAIANSWNNVTPCNMPLRAQATDVAAGLREAGCVPVEFCTIAMSDVIAMGHEGMRASLVSREVIADSVEAMVIAERFDAMVTIAGCDKSLPAMMMAAVRTNIPTVFSYGGSTLPGCTRKTRIDIKDVFEGVGAVSAGLLD